MANHSTFGDLSTTAASNTSIDNNDVSENCPMPGMNNAIRSLGAMGRGALTYVATSGTDVYTATLVPAPDAYATGFQYLVDFLSVNTSTTPSINLNILGALTITLGDGATPLVPGSLNGRHILTYDGSVMRVLNPAKIASAYLPATITGNFTFSGGIDFTGQTYSPEVALPAATGTVTIDLSTGNNFGGTITGNITLANPTNPKAGQSGAIRFTQDATGGRTITYGTNWKFQGGVQPPLSTAANAVDILSYYVKDTTTVIGNMLSNVS